MSGNDSTAGKNINQIPTLWTDVRRAHSDAAGDATAAQQRLLERYRPAVYRYLRTCLGRPDYADEVWSEFSLRVVRGDLRNANPEKGRFRDLLKAVVYHLVIDFHKKRKRSMPNLAPDTPELVDDSPETTSASDAAFLMAWKTELLGRCWQALAEEERRTGRLMYTVLKCRADHPEMRSHHLAEALTKQLNRPTTADWVRKWVREARSHFAATLLREVAGSLKEPSIEAVEEELIELELYQYCKEAVDRWRESVTCPTIPYVPGQQPSLIRA